MESKRSTSPKHLVRAFLLAVTVVAVAQASPAWSRELGFEERVRAQEAIERVYYTHQLGAHQPFEEAVPRDVLEKKVSTYLEQSAALEQRSGTPITEDMLRSEQERMLGSSRMPERLRELFAALGNDPLLIQECLARPALVERLGRPTLASDGAIPIKGWGDAVSRASDPSAGAASSIVARTLESDAPSVSEVSSCAAAWRDLPTPGPLQSWGFTAVWTGNEMIIWGGAGGPTTNTGGRYNPATDTWSPTSTTNAPIARVFHTAVWTGSLMVVFGGRGPSSEFLDSGGRYDPITDTWSPTQRLGAPVPRQGATAVWTGSVAIFWGGFGQTDPSTTTWLNTGGRYDPLTNSWMPMRIGPDARDDHTAIWTGSRMIVWGGTGYMPRNDGSRYDPITDTWTPTSLTGAPLGRYGHSAVWTGSTMIVLGGTAYNWVELSDGGTYDPDHNSWTPLVAPIVPRSEHTAVWTGTQMVVWGGQTSYFGGTATNTGAIYSPADGQWAALPTAGAPSARWDHTAVWTGSSMIVWGAYPSLPAVPLGAVLDFAPDQDGDGYTCEDDCDDTDPAVHPGAQETCNGRDDDCNGLADDLGGVLDADGDGIAGACDACPNDPANDVDGDGVCGDVDNCPAYPNADQSNLDGDALGDACDPCPLDPANDADGDGVCGSVDNCPAAANTDQANADGDAYGDVCDPCPLDAANDADGDGVCGNVDNCPTVANPDQRDTDGDGIGDACDGSGPVDSDGDGVPDDQDACDHSILDPTVVVPPVTPPPPPPGTTAQPVIPCDSGVPNYLLASGCTISDRIAACDASTNNKGQFDKCVKRLLDQLRRAHVITESERKKIDHCVKKYKKRDTRHHGQDDSHGGARDH